MQKIEIALQKRTAKMLLYAATAFPLTFMTIGIIGAMISSFVWYYIIALILFGFGAYLVYGGLIEYFMYKDVKLVVESDGETIKFYNTNAAGKVFNQSEVLKLDEMKRFYIVEASTRYLMKNYSFAFEGKGTMGSLLSDDVECFPKLYECRGEDRRDVLDFVSSIAPNIVMGYESLWQRALNNRS